jgi:hydrogenase nickel incorporation protein HypA/HybF
MHEMGIVQSIMDILEEQAKIHNAKKVVRVNLEFGVLTAVMPEAIRFAFDVLSKGTVAEEADINITIIPLKMRCMDCNEEHTLHEYQPICPSCSSAAILILEGRDEMRIASLEVDDRP